MTCLSLLHRKTGADCNCASIVTELPVEIAEHKGVEGYRMEAMRWLQDQSRVNIAATG